MIKSPGIISFSGGKDSMLLLDFYSFLHNRGLIPGPVVFHLSHNIRSNQLEENQIHEFMLSLNYKSIFESKNIPNLSKRISKSLEETGRIKRYHSLTKIAKKNLGYIVTGHHTKDYLESVFIHWIRGGGKKSLETLPVWNGSIMRPLLFLQDEELQFLYNTFSDKKIWEDESNQNISFLRNRIRKTAIEFFEKEKLNFYKLYHYFHDQSLEEIELRGEDSEINFPGYLIIPASTVNQIKTIIEWKSLMDLHTRMLRLHPIKKGSLEESYRMIRSGRSFEFKTKEIFLSKQTKGPLYLIPHNSAVLLKTREIHEGNATKIQWNGKTYQLKESESWGEISPGEKIIINGINQEISEILRMNYIPPIIRKNIPIIRKNKKAIKILLELFQ
ncbi:MAG: tRNA lysidine(34) synthetase TilS [Leptospira sp.]|nr:tRNA lysidine(34) synthetase TilS [Leptospira sp.]